MGDKVYVCVYVYSLKKVWITHSILWNSQSSVESKMTQACFPWVSRGCQGMNPYINFLHLET